MKKLLELWKKYSFIVLLVFVILGAFDSRIALAAIFCMLGPIVLSIFKGRFWCGNICPRGSFYDTVLSKISNKRKVPYLLKSPAFRFAVVVFMMSMFANGIISNWGDLAGIGFVFYRMIVATTVIGIIFSAFFNHRTWCHFCPMGTMASVISRFRKNKNVLKVSSGCVSCKKCEKKCPIGIVPYDFRGDILSHPDCIQCKECVTVCHMNAIRYDEKN